MLCTWTAWCSSARSLKKLPKIQKQIFKEGEKGPRSTGTWKHQSNLSNNEQIPIPAAAGPLPSSQPEVSSTAAPAPSSSPVISASAPTAESLPLLARPDNTHSMCTRAKAGIVKPRIQPTLLLTHAEPKSTKSSLFTILLDMQL